MFKGEVQLDKVYRIKDSREVRLEKEKSGSKVKSSENLNL